LQSENYGGMLGSVKECSGAYFSTRARKMDPQMDPRETGLAPSFSSDSLCIFAVAVLPSVAIHLVGCRFKQRRDQ
jgi:hypothetical protein